MINSGNCPGEKAGSKTKNKAGGQTGYNVDNPTKTKDLTGLNP